MSKTKPDTEPGPAAVRAAGGIVRRPLPERSRLRHRLRPRHEIALVHRPRYDDWSVPKGKPDGDEPDEDTALREVEEETGWRPGPLGVLVRGGWYRRRPLG